MNMLTLGVSGLFAVLAMVFSAMLVFAILRNLKTGRRYRQGLAEQLSGLRLGKMLDFHGIDRSSYLHVQPVLDIREQMTRCAACAQTAQCDQALETGKGDTAAFCDNDTSLGDLKSQTHARS